MQTLRSRLETVVHCFDADFRGFRIKSSKADAMKWLMRFNLPYVVREHAPGKYLILNREYKPLGFMAAAGGHGPAYAVYDEHVITGEPGMIGDDFYFYNDITVPWENSKNWKDYQKKLKNFVDELPA